MRRLKVLLVASFLLMVMRFPAEAMFYSGGSYWIDQVMPTTVGNTGKATINIIGEIPKAPPYASIWGPGYGLTNEIVGTVVKWSKDAFNNSWGGTSSILTVTFDLSGMQKGTYAVSFPNPDYPTDPSYLVYHLWALTVEDGKGPDLWVMMSGETTVRVGSKTTYRVFYGNSGGIDVPSAILYLAIPKEMTYKLLFDPAPYQNFWYPGISEAAGGLEPNFEGDFDAKPYSIIPLSIQNLAPGMAAPLKIEVTWGSSPAQHLLRAFWHGSKSTSYRPLWGNP